MCTRISATRKVSTIRHKHKGISSKKQIAQFKKREETRHLCVISETNAPALKYMTGKCS
jgi:hypothetical protein